jgi:hypothetical protein
VTGAGGLDLTTTADYECNMKNWIVIGGRYMRWAKTRIDLRKLAPGRADEIELSAFLIRRSTETVQPMRRNPYPQVMIHQLCGQCAGVRCRPTSS